jgi:hypothetical protein
MIVGISLVLAIILLGFFREYEGTMAMASTNSRAISAACHVLREDREYGYLLPVRWGNVGTEGGIGHCAFTTATEIRAPEKADTGIKYE